ncbi:MAG: 4-aminobutyrate--2-oxoglutarate transaminase [Bifidobacteriaceae bacterium]|jgi:4-aminobutyrate aminotransferase/(S)-3-amino-2-methylpropionate transaminase|nr:4-aminobutyrate--2-oxoglutarate transaminase [Bifidobacteriaceae bacterium]
MTAIANTVGGPSLPQVRRLSTRLPGPKSRALAERMRAALPPALTSPTVPVFAAAAGGGVIVDVDGNSLIDLGSGIAVTTVGVSHPGVVAAVHEQVAALTHTCFMVTPYESYVALAEQLIRRYPGRAATGSAGEPRAAFFNSGAEAVENAVKIARAATGRDAVVAFDHAFHGRTNLTMAMTSKAKPYKSGFGPFTSEIYRLPGSYPYRDQLTGPEAASRWIKLAESQIGASDLAAVVLEPVQGEGGFIVPAPGFVPAVAEWCKANGVVFVADEIQSGIARTGQFFAIEHEGVQPDLITVAKGLAGGMPLSGVIGRAEIMDKVQPGGIGGTYGGNPSACAAALAVLEAIESEGLLERAKQIGEILHAHLGAIAVRDSRLGEVRGRGAMVAAEVVNAQTGEPDAVKAKAIAKFAIERGVVVLTCGTYGNVLRFLPPLAISDELLREALDVVAEGFAAAP